MQKSVIITIFLICYLVLKQQFKKEYISTLKMHKSIKDISWKNPNFHFPDKILHLTVHCKTCFTVLRFKPKSLSGHTGEQNWGWILFLCFFNQYDIFNFKSTVSI